MNLYLVVYAYVTRTQYGVSYRSANTIREAECLTAGTIKRWEDELGCKAGQEDTHIVNVIKLDREGV